VVGSRITAFRLGRHRTTIVPAGCGVPGRGMRAGSVGWASTA